MASAKTIFASNDEVLNNTIQFVPAEGETPEYYVADNTRVKSEFYADRVVFESRGYRFTWTPQAMKYADAFGEEDTVYSVQDVPLEVKANYVRYNRSMPDIDDWFIQENDRLKHQILVQGFQRDPMPWLFGDIDFVIGGKIEFDAALYVKADGALVSGPFETDGRIEIVDADGNTVFTLPEVVAYDSKIPERAMTYGKYRVTSSEGGVLAFGIVVSNAWVTDVERVYPLVIDPTVVVSSTYDTSGTDGRKLVRLSSGYLYAAMLNSTSDFRIYKSVDNGTTWSLLVTVSGDEASDIALATDGTYLLVLNNVASGSVRFRKYSESGVLQGSMVNVDTGQSTTSIEGPTVAVDGSGNLHAAWSSKNSTYSTCPNIRYSKSTDGGVTWTTATQLTTTGDSTFSYNERPCVVIQGNGHPMLIWKQYINTTAYYSIIRKSWDGSAWTEGTVYSSVRALQTPCAAVDSSSVIHVVWSGRDDVMTTTSRIRYSKSSNGGATWSAPLLLADSISYDQMYPTITIDQDNKIRVFWYGIDYLISTTFNNIRKIESSDGGSTWSSVTTLTSNTTGHAQYPSALWSKHYMNSTDAVRWIYQDAQAGSVKYDTISLNAAPTAPTGLSRTNFDATAAAVFTWSFSDPNSGNTQSAYQMLIKRVSDGVTVVDTGKVASTASSRTVSASTLSNNVQYQWQVKTWDNLDAEGPYSSLATFFTSAKPSSTITVPATDGATVGTTSLTAEWTFSDPESEGQSAYQIKLTDNSDSVLWDSGKVTDVSGRSRTISYTLVNSTSYKVKLTVWDFRDVISTEVVRTFSTSFVVPATPTIVATAQAGYIGLTVTNPAPSGGQPVVNSNDIYRRKSGETAWVRIAAGVIANGSYNDYAVASGTTYEYKVTALGASNGTTADSATDSESLTLSGIWLHDVADPSGTVYNFKLDGQGRESEWKPDVTIMQFAGRTLPVAEFGESEEGKLSASLQLLKNALDFTKLDALVRRKATICWRDSYGRKAFGIIPSLPISDEHWGYSTSIELVEIAYSEVV